MCIDKMRYIMIGCALALIALAGCKTPELSMDERISLPESGEMGMNDTTFVKPLSWDVFFQDTLLRGYVDVALRNNHSFRQSTGAHRHEPRGLAAGEGAFAAGREFEHRSLREPFR